MTSSALATCTQHDQGVSLHASPEFFCHAGVCAAARGVQKGISFANPCQEGSENDAVYLCDTWQSQPAGRFQQALQLGAAIIGAGYQRAERLQQESLCRVLVVCRSPSICTCITFLPCLVELFGTPSSEGVLTKNGTMCYGLPNF